MSLSLRKLLLSVTGRNRLSILIYHRVHEKIDPLVPNEVDAYAFDWQMNTVSRFFNVLPLSKAIHLLTENSLPKASLAITFDDGYADNAAVALPILQKYQLPATFFIATGFLDGGRMWNDTIYETIRSLPSGRYDLSAIGLGDYSLDTREDRIFCAQSLISSLKHLPPADRSHKTEYLASIAARELPDNLMMTSDQVREIATAGMELGGHTVTHPILSSLTDFEVSQEIEEGALRLKEIAGKPIRLFAYPNGKPDVDYRPEHVDLVKDLGFEGAVSTSWGVSDQYTDIYQLRRFTPWDRTQTRFLLRLLRNYYHRPKK